jgi:hypothetical protein
MHHQSILGQFSRHTRTLCWQISYTHSHLRKLHALIMPSKDEKVSPWSEAGTWKEMYTRQITVVKNHS